MLEIMLTNLCDTKSVLDKKFLLKNNEGKYLPSIDKALNYSKQQTYTNTCYVLFFVVLFLHSIVHISDSVIYWQII